jgi:hypothetical protein
MIVNALLDFIVFAININVSLINILKPLHISRYLCAYITIAMNKVLIINVNYFFIECI